MVEEQDYTTEHSGRSYFFIVLEFIWEVVKIVLVSLAIIIPIRYYIIQPFYVKGASMEPNFYNHDYLIICEACYLGSGEPMRGDVVVFKYPDDPSQYFIKRIIGLPGESVEIKDNQIIIYNSEYPQGKILDERNYLPEDDKSGNYKLTQVDDNSYFVLGDNRDESKDSRSFGLLSEDLIIGKVWLRGWPIDRLADFQTPQYNF